MNKNIDETKQKEIQKNDQEIKQEDKQETAAQKPAGKKTRYWDRFMAVIALVIIVIAWLIGMNLSEEGLTPHIKQVIPNTGFIENGSGNTYTAWKETTKESLLGHIAIGRAHGYGGEMIIAAAVDKEGNVMNTHVVSHKETPAFFNRVTKSVLSDWLLKKPYSHDFQVDNALDGVSGATLTSQAIADATRRAARIAAVENLGATPLPEPIPSIRFGLPEIMLILLFVVGFVGRRPKFKYTKAARWFSMIAGLLFLGFLFNRPLTIVLINKMLLGYWPLWQTNLYWYLLVGGVLLIYAMDNKNSYCQWFCPFGATQECLAVVGGGKVKIPEKYRTPLRWFPRLLALTAIVTALILRNPGISSYEVFGVMFHLVGSGFLFVLTGVVLVVSLFIKRPWCTYLCPLKPVTDYVQLSRTWIKEKTKQKK